MAESLTEGLVRLLRRPVSADDRARAALHVLDWIGCAVIGAAEPAGVILRRTGPLLGAGGCHAIGVTEGLAAPAAGFVNGGFGNVLEMDDIHRTSILHPGPVVVPAALALAEARGAGTGAFLDAVVRGYEAMIRIGRSVGPGHYANWHNTSTCGPFGAAAAAGELLGLDEAAMVWALGNAGTQASGPWRCRHEPVMSKQLHTARAAHAGLVAAELAAAGFTGPAFILEGTNGFYDAMAPDADPDAVLAGPDAAWLVHETSFKPWPACRHAHAAIDAALALRERGVRPDALASLEIETYGDAALFCDRPAPTTVIEAKFSLQHAVAVALTDGPPPLEAFTPAAIARPEIAALREKTRVAVTPRYDADYPRHYGSGIVASLVTGERVESYVPDALGDPENPVDAARVEEKARTLMAAGGLDNAAVEAIVGAAKGLAGGGPLPALLGALRRTADAARNTPEFEGR